MYDLAFKAFSEDGDGRYYRLRVSQLDTIPEVKTGQYVELTAAHVIDDDLPVEFLGRESCTQYCVVARRSVCDSSLDELEFLIKSDSHIARLLTLPGTKLSMGTPAGGFDISDVRGREVVCFAAGSGIAGIVSLLDDFHRKGDVLDCVVFYMETAGGFAYDDLLEDVNCTVHRIKSEGALSSNLDEPLLGMIAKLSGTSPITFPRRPIVFVCGPKVWADRLRDGLVPVHVVPEDFRLNL